MLSAFTPASQLAIFQQNSNNNHGVWSDREGWRVMIERLLQRNSPEGGTKRVIVII